MIGPSTKNNLFVYKTLGEAREKFVTSLHRLVPVGGHLEEFYFDSLESYVSYLEKIAHNNQFKNGKKELPEYYIFKHAYYFDPKEKIRIIAVILLGPSADISFLEN